MQSRLAKTTIGFTQSRQPFCDRAKVEQPDLLELIALVGDQEVGHTLVKEDCVEVVVPEEDCQLIGSQAFPYRRQAVVCQLARAAVQKVLQTWCEPRC